MPDDLLKDYSLLVLVSSVWLLWPTESTENSDIFDKEHVDPSLCRCNFNIGLSWTPADRQGVDGPSG